LFSVKMDHIAMWYNFIALSVDFEWSPKEVLQPLVQQAVTDKNWEGYSSKWLLRVCSKAPGISQDRFSQHRYQNLFLPLMKSSSQADQWQAYCKFTSSLF